MTQVVGFTNRIELLDGGRTQARAAALDIAAAGLAALDPEAATLRALTRSDHDLVIAGRRHSLAGRRVHLVGAGKASLAIARAVLERVGDVLTDGPIVVHHANQGRPDDSIRPAGSIRVVEADHPIPSERSHDAGALLMEAAASVAPGDLVIACFTGGSSALASIPAPGITSGEKILVSELLLASGLDIVEMNTVRKHISAIKGGRLASLLAGATIVNLTVSDVAGNHLDSITDPTVQDTTSPQEAVGILRRSDLWEKVPASVRARLEEGIPAPDLKQADIQTVVVATGGDACRAMQRRAGTLGYSAATVSTEWSGEAVDNGATLGKLALACRTSQGPVGEPGVLIACGGESTVTLEEWRPKAGQGGPNQEFALAAAAVISGQEAIAVLALDTDGCDGGTDWAGALVDGDTQARLGEGALKEALTSHASTAALAASGDLIASGPTGTNVNDLYVAVIGHE